MLGYDSSPRSGIPLRPLRTKQVNYLKKKQCS